MSGNAVFPRFKAWRANGITPANGYKLYTYESGTTTPKTTYSDPDLLVPNANPVILDSIGEATIFLSEGPYKFSLYTPNDSLVWTFDPVTSAGLTVQVVSTINDLRALETEGQTSVQVLGYLAIGDGAGGDFYWDAGDSSPDDGGLTIRPNSMPALGRWKRIHYREIKTSWFGTTTNFFTSLVAGLSTSYTIVVDSIVSLGVATTISDNIHLVPMQGGGFTSPGSINLTILGTLNPTGFQWIFGGVNLVAADTLAMFRVQGDDELDALLVYGNGKVKANGINIWRGAGPGDTTSPGPGEEGPGWFNQTCVGLESGESFTTGNDNTAFGYRTLKAATTALDCTAVGADCMAAVVDGIANTAVGWRSMLLITGGEGNAAFGHRAMGEATGGTHNVAVGGRTLFNNESLGIRNVAIGQQAMESNTEGDNNVAVGYLSQQASTIQNRNTSVGSRTLEFLVGDAMDDEIGADNTAVGWSAMQSLTTGHTNTAIGLQAGRRLKTGGGAVSETVINSVYIGANTDASADGVENENVFGFAADGMGSNTVVLGNDSITDTYLKGLVRAPGNVIVSGVLPAYYLDEDDQGTDGRRWFIRASDGIFEIECQTDDSSDGKHVLRSTRSGNSILSLWFGNTIDNPSYEFLGTGSVTFGGNIILPTSGGTVIGTATTQLLAFWGAAPTSQLAAIADADGSLGDVTSKFNTLLSRLETVGLLAA